MLIARSKVTVLPMPGLPTPLLRTRTDDDLDVLFSMAADLDTWEERNPWAPAPLTRKRFDARLAHAAESDAHTAAITQLIEFGFVRRNLRRIHLQATASNVGAIRAYEKAGSWSRVGCANMRGSEARTRTLC